MADQEITTINLSNEISVNGVKYPKGTGVKVPKAQAEDILRIDHDHTQYLLDLNKKKSYQKDAGTIAVGSAE